MIEIGNRVKMKRSGEIGTVIDRAYSEKNKSDIFCIALDSSSRGSRVYYSEDDIESVFSDEKWAYRIELDDNVVIATLNQVDDNGNFIREIERGHGHVIHDGVEGFAQAASYALKRIYYKVGGLE